MPPTSRPARCTPRSTSSSRSATSHRNGRTRRRHAATSGRRAATSISRRPARARSQPRSPATRISSRCRWRPGASVRRKPDAMLLRVLLAVIDAATRLAPPSRRRDWRRQWRADIVHEWRRVDRGADASAGRAALIRRTAGAVRHAFWLRGHVRRLEMVSHDLRYGWRLMLRKPGFTVVAVLTLGLGIGANVTIFSWVDAMLRRQLQGVPDPDRFVALNSTSRTRSDLSLSYPDFVDIRQRRLESVDDVIVFTLAPLNLRTDAEPQRVWGELVSGNFFSALGVHVAHGRAFLPEEDREPSTHPVVVFSHNFWQRRFG